MARSTEKPRSLEDVSDRSKPWQLVEIVEPGQCRQITMSDNSDSSSKVSGLSFQYCVL